jgi:DNA invertase Pin-like site-specific DNA recombinase
MPRGYWRAHREANGDKRAIINPDKAAEFLRLRKQGLTLQEIGAKFGISRQAVSDFLVRAKERQSQMAP